MSSQALKEAEGYKAEEKVFDRFDGAENTKKSDLNNIVNNMLEADNKATDGDEPDSYHPQMKAKLMHPSTSPIDAAPIDNNMDSSNTDSKRRNSKFYSEDGKGAEISQLSRYRTYRELFSYGRRGTAESKGYSTDMLRGISYYAAFEDGLPSSPEPEPFYARYRKSGPDLITLHIFTGETKGKTPIYVPVYKRDEIGQLFKLMGKRSGHWEYMELKRLSEEEIEGGLKLWKNPKEERELKTSGINNAVGRRTPADLRLRETQLKGG